MLVTRQNILRRFCYPIVPSGQLTDAPTCRPISPGC